MSSSEPEQSHRPEEEETAPAEDEDTGAQVAPIVRLEEVAVTTGEEEEESILDLYGQLFLSSSSRVSNSSLIFSLLLSY
jgi:Ran-binding protein 1